MSMTNCVFIVDDDPSARKGLARLLRTGGHDVRDFSSVNEFLNTLGLEVSGCVILDARVLGLSGEELLTGLKASGIHLPIIVVSADIDPQAWDIIEGKPYLNLNADIQQRRAQDKMGNIHKADKNWPDLFKR